MDPELRLQRAQALVNDELLTEAFDTLRTELMDRWENSASTEVEARESIWLAMRLLDRLYGHITSIVETGHMNKVMERQHPFI